MINIVLGDSSTGATLVAQPAVHVDAIAGSVLAGRTIGKSAVENLKRSHLELGGKAPCSYVLTRTWTPPWTFFSLILLQVFHRPDIAVLSKNTLVNLLTCLVFIVIASTISHRGLDTTKAVQYILAGFQLCVLVMFSGMALYHLYNGTAFDRIDFSWDWLNLFGVGSFYIFAAGIALSVVIYWGWDVVLHERRNRRRALHVRTSRHVDNHCDRGALPVDFYSSHLLFGSWGGAIQARQPRKPYHETTRLPHVPGGVGLPRSISAIHVHQPSLDARAEETYSRLLTYDQQHGTELAPTLAAYLHSGSLIAATSELLGVHRHTVRTRLARIAEVCEVDLSSPVVCAELLLIVITRG